MIFVAFAVLIVVAVIAGAAAIAFRSKRSFVESNEIVPGTATRAPTSWAGAHSPEAKLHRRLRDAVLAVRAEPTLTDPGSPGSPGSRAMLEQAALDIDDRLIAAAALPATHRDAAIGAVEPAVVALEDAIAKLAAPAGAATSQQALDDAIGAVQSRLIALAEARAELDQFDVTSKGTPLPVARTEPSAVVETASPETKTPEVTATEGGTTHPN